LLVLHLIIISLHPLNAFRHHWNLHPQPGTLERIAREQEIRLPNSSLIGDKAFPDPTFEAMLKEQRTTLYTPLKKPKGKDLSKSEKYDNRLVSKLRQPIESFFNWLIDETDLHRAGTVRSTGGLMVHCFR
jgi:histidinol phosphatase-like enzyme